MARTPKDDDKQAKAAEAAFRKALDEGQANSLRGDDAIRAFLDSDVVMDVMIKMQIKAAASGSTSAIKWLFDRGYGTPSQTIKHTGKIDLSNILADPTATDVSSDFDLD